MGAFDVKAAVFINRKSAKQTVTGADQMIRFRIKGNIVFLSDEEIPIGTEGVISPVRHINIILIT